MVTTTNELAVPEITAYSREEIDDLVVVRYLVRNPGEAEWQPVKITRPNEIEHAISPAILTTPDGHCLEAAQDVGLFACWEDAFYRVLTHCTTGRTTVLVRHTGIPGVHYATLDHALRHIDRMYAECGDLWS